MSVNIERETTFGLILRAEHSVSSSSRSTGSKLPLVLADIDGMFEMECVAVYVA